MSVKEQINQTLIAAMKAKKMDEVKVLRGVQAAIKQIEIDKQVVLDEAGIFELLQKQIKQRQESLVIYKDNGREDLASKEQFELDVIATFLPQPLDAQELEGIIRTVITELSATSIKDMGKVMNEVKARTAGRADPANISVLVKQLLS